MQFEELIPALQSSIAPVIVISGVGLVLLSMTNRFGRVIDRGRIIGDLLRGSPGASAKRLKRELDILRRRARLLRTAILLAAMSLLCAGGLVIVLFLASIVGFDAIGAIVTLFLGCMAALMMALGFFVVDINASLEAFDLATRIDEIEPL